MVRGGTDLFRDRVGPTNLTNEIKIENLSFKLLTMPSIDRYLRKHKLNSMISPCKAQLFVSTTDEN